MYRKNDFAKVSKNLIRYRSVKIILLDYQNYYVEHLNIMSNVAKNFEILAWASYILMSNKIIFRFYLIEFF